MNRIIGTGLFLLALIVVGTPAAKAETRIERQLQQTHSPTIGSNVTVPPKPLPVSLMPWSVNESGGRPTIAPLSERDRLIQERFLLQLIPAQPH